MRHLYRYLLDRTKPEFCQNGVRPLTQGEINMAMQVFGRGIDYEQVRISKLNFLSQITANAMVISHRIDLPCVIFDSVDDFAQCARLYRLWFVHEMTHIWQYQLGLSTFWAGFWVLCQGQYFGLKAYQNGIKAHKPKAYGYDLRQQALPLSCYSMEQQAEIISHYFDILVHAQASPFWAYRQQYERTLERFLQNPNSPALLPKHPSRLR